MADRYTIQHIKNKDFEIYTINDTVTNLPYRYCFNNREDAQAVCDKFNAEHRKEQNNG